MCAGTRAGVAVKVKNHWAAAADRILEPFPKDKQLRLVRFQHSKNFKKRQIVCYRSACGAPHAGRIPTPWSGYTLPKPLGQGGLNIYQVLCKSPDYNLCCLCNILPLMRYYFFFVPFSNETKLLIMTRQFYFNVEAKIYSTEFMKLWCYFIKMNYYSLIFSMALIDKRMWQNVPDSDFDIVISFQIKISSSDETFISRTIKVDMFRPIN